MKTTSLTSHILCVFGLISLSAIAAISYAATRMNTIDSNYSKIATGPLPAATAIANASQSLASLHQDIAQLLIVTAQSDNDAEFSAIKSDRANFDAAMQTAATLSPENAATLITIKSTTDTAIDNNCAQTVAEGYASTTQSGNLAVQITYLRNCSPQFPPIAKQMRAEQTTLQNQATHATSSLHTKTKDSIITIVAITLTSLAAIMAGAYLLAQTWVISPIKSLQSALTRLATGDYKTAIPGQSRTDEIGNIAKAIDVLKQAGIENTLLQQQAAETDQRMRQERANADSLRETATRNQTIVVTAIAQGLSKLASGNLLTRLNHTFDPEYETLRQDFNNTVNRLHDSLSVIASETAGLLCRSGHIADISDQLADATQLQTTSLEKTAAAFTAFATTVKRTNRGIIEARDAATEARHDAETSGAVVTETTVAINGIASSAKQIDNIIGVIDEIAFQTNLLALNAGVEAARAGDAGRGFAVVASEVRALAQRSATAAKQIKQLISVSSQQVTSGVKLVDATGNAINRICNHITRFEKLVSELAALAQDQINGIRNVNAAANKMADITKRNETLAEHATNASHELATEANALAQFVSQFKLTETHYHQPETIDADNPQNGNEAATHHLNRTAVLRTR